MDEWWQRNATSVIFQSYCDENMFTTGESDRFQLDENIESQNKMETLKALFHLLRDIIGYQVKW